MQIFKPTVSLFLDTRRSKKTGTYPLKLRVTYIRQSKYYGFGVDLTENEFSLVTNQNAIKTIKDIAFKRKIQDTKLKCDTNIVKANEIITKLIDFTFDRFEKKFFQHEQSREDVYAYYEVTIAQQKKEGRVGTASSYQSSLTSLKEFKASLTFRDVTVSFLKDYEKWLLSNNKSITTVGVYLRPLRAIINTAIADGIISRETHYPFGKRLYQIPTGRNIKKALTAAEMRLIIEYDSLKGTWWEKAKDFFVFSYMGNGINMKDILLLKWKDIDGDKIRFIRAKTMGTNKTNVTAISFHLSSHIKAIIDRWKSTLTAPDDFIFPFLTKDMSIEKQQAVIKQFTRMVNEYLKDITKAAGINKHVTTYYARHSFATILKRSGFSTEVISESLGHSNIKTTNSYLDSFDSEVQKDIAERLVRF